jgi:putative transposase
MMGNSQRERLLLRAARRIEDGAPVARVCRELGIDEAVLAAWRWERVPKALTLAERVADLERENRHLRSTITDLRCHRRLLLDAFNIVFPAPNEEPEPEAVRATPSNRRKRSGARDKGRAWVM